MGVKTERLLRRVALRQRLRCLGRQAHATFLALGAAYALMLLCARLLGIIPDWFRPVTLLTLAAASLALALAFYRRPSPTEPARLADERTGAEDLFLTAVAIDSAAGRYQPVVLRDAEQAAAAVRAREVVPWRWASKARNVALALAVLLAGVLYLPQFDPFGRDEARSRRAEQRRRIEEARKAVALRTAMLKQKSSADLSAEVRKAVGELKQTFRAMKPEQKKADLKRLGAVQARLGKLWRKASENRLRNALPLANQLQRFGEGGSRKFENWQQELQAGRSGGLKKELSELKDMARKLARTKDPAEREALRRELKRRLEDLKDFAAEQVGAMPLSAALGQALDQLAMSGLEGLSADALDALDASLELSEAELDALAQSVRDLAALEEALQAAQWARRLGELGLLDGKQCDSCEAMADYMALYKKTMAGRCPSCGKRLSDCAGTGACAGAGMGPGTGGTGRGAGGIAPEDPEARTDFQPEKSRSALTAGKILLSLKGRGVPDAGEAVVQYGRSVEDIKQGLNEAILHEQVPPAYHEAIRKYFDAMEGTSERAGPE